MARYVDDILIVWTGTHRKVDVLLLEMNVMNESIKFTVEKGIKTINHLELTLTLDNNRIECKIYRKPTHRGIIIPNDSYHHPSAPQFSDNPELLLSINFCPHE